jgi:hypothetical protein
LKQEIQTKRRQLEEAYQLKADIPQRLTDGRINYLLDEMASDDFVADTNRISASEWGKTVMKNELFFNPTPLRGASTSTPFPTESGMATKLITDGSGSPVTATTSGSQQKSSSTALISISHQHNFKLKI